MTMRRMFTASLIAGVVLLGATPAVAAPRIIGGTEATESYPFIAEIQSRKFVGADWKHQCGGTLVAPTWVLTAAHCVQYGPDPGALDTFRLRVGSLNRTTGGTMVTAKRFVVHPTYLTSKYSKADIALVELAAPMPYEPIGIGAGTQTRLLGWGATSCSTGMCTGSPEMLRQLDTTVLPAADCASSAIDVGDLCVDSPNGEGACYGDSGSPSLVKDAGRWRVSGVDSRGTTSGMCGTSPDIYTSASAYGDWISQTLRG